MLNRIKKIFRMIVPRFSHQREPEALSLKTKPPIHFNSISVKDRTPSNADIKEKEFVLVKFRKKPVWALFECPCGCGHVISLSLQKNHYKNWSVKKTKSGRPTLYPSVWQTTGCYSHFWITDGRVHWCTGSGEKFSKWPMPAD